MKKIISGGQTGADRAALDAAIDVGFPVGGYCPKGRLAEDGPIDARYPLIEIEGGYRQRTEQNVAESDATIIFYDSEPMGGTELTIFFSIKAHKPYKLIDMSLISESQAAESIFDFTLFHDVQTLNVAGPRASDCPGVYDYVRKVMATVLKKYA